MARHPRVEVPERPHSANKPLLGALAGVTLLLAACGPSFPLGMSEAEWRLLTPQQQHEARMKQADVNRAHAQRRAAAAAERRQRMALAEAGERRRLAALYGSGRFGDVLECVVEGGSADFHPGWRPYTPAPFTLARGERKYVPMRDSHGKQGRFWASYSPDGVHVRLCYRQPHRGYSGRRCATISAGSRDFAWGVRHDIRAKNVFQNASLFCAYRPGYGMPKMFVQRHRVDIYRHIHRYHRPHTSYRRDHHVVRRQRHGGSERPRSILTSRGGHRAPHTVHAPPRKPRPKYDATPRRKPRPKPNHVKPRRDPRPAYVAPRTVRRDYDPPRRATRRHGRDTDIQHRAPHSGTQRPAAGAPRGRGSAKHGAAREVTRAVENPRSGRGQVGNKRPADPAPRMRARTKPMPGPKKIAPRRVAPQRRKPVAVTPTPQSPRGGNPGYDRPRKEEKP